MTRASRILIAFVAVQHLLFLVVEMFLWQSEAVMARFGTSPEFAAESAVLAMNQGLYNGFLAAGLGWALTQPTPARGWVIARFFLVCVVVAAVFGGFTAKPSILLVQGLPASIALVLGVLAQRAAARTGAAA